MKEYVEFESNVIKFVKRGLMEWEEAIGRCVGYLHAMVDFGILPECRLSEEITITVRNILEIK